MTLFKLLFFMSVGKVIAIVCIDMICLIICLVMRINEGIIPRPLSLYSPKSVAATVSRTRLRTNITEEELSRKLEEEFWVKFKTEPSKDTKRAYKCYPSTINTLFFSPASL